MEQCYLCQGNVITTYDSNNTKMIGIKLDDDRYVCIGCNEALEFTRESTRKKKKPVIIKPPTTSLYKCYKCGHSYNGTVCDECNTPNIYAVRSNKKKRKKRKKRK